MKNKFLLLWTAILVLATGSVFAQTGGVHKTEVIILHLNDMHAKIDGFAKIKYLADSLKRSHTYVFIVSAGDNFTGNPYVDMVADKGAPMIDLMNRSGFNLSCFGNHEFDLGQAFLEKRIQQAEFPFICANVNTGTSGVWHPKAYFLLKAGELQIPVMGLIEVNENGIPDTHPAKVAGMSFTDPIKTSADYIELKKKYGSLIALSHLGVETDEKLAREYPQFDVIIGGHSHTILKKAVTENGVLIVQAGSYQRFIGKLTLVFNGNHVEEKSDTLIAMESLTGSDKALEKLADSYSNNPEFDKTAGIAIVAISGKQDLGALMTDAIAWAVKSDFAFQNKGGIRIQSLHEGEIKLKDIYRLDPFGNQVVIYKMSGKEIGILILNAYKKERDADLIPSGMSYVIKKGENGKSAEVIIADSKGRPLNPDKTYTVALNSYISAAYSFEHSGSGTTLDMTTEECLIRYLGNRHKVRYKDTERANFQSTKEKN
ncbi:MAG: bifunctional UDP-sugar hydrolase/5'-nucleotidase [Bacteroidota bacterium]|jgi:5'-nucleotidase / UDP-sugar diphosphatase